MKVLLIDSMCKQGSHGNIVYDLYSYLNANDHEVAVCYGRGREIKEHNILKFGYDWETYLHAFLTRITGFTGCFSYFSTKRLLKFIEDFKPDIVHIHELHAYFVNIKPLLDDLKAKKIKTVLTLHCEFDYTGKCGHSYECTKWKTECGNCPHLHDYPKSLFFDFTKQMFRQKKELFKGFDNLTVITPSQWLADRTKESFLGCYPIHVIHNGVDNTVFYPRNTDVLRKKHNIKDDERVVLAVAPDIMSNLKGGKYVLQLAETLKDEDFRFIMIGVDGVTEEVRDNIILKGRTSDRNELAEYYSLADAFVICSNIENFPTTCIEAQLCGTPAYGFDAGGTKETFIVQEGHVSALYDTQDLAEKLKKLPQKSRDIADNIAKLAKEQFDKEKFAETTNTVYKTIFEG